MAGVPRGSVTTLVVGASGATGRLLVAELLRRNQRVKVIVRSPHKLAEAVLRNPNVAVISASILSLSDEELAHHVKGCHAVASCLGHNMSFKGIYGKPRNLVAEARRFQEPADPHADYPEAPLEPAITRIIPGGDKAKLIVLGLANDEIGYIIPKRQWDAVAPFASGRSSSQYGEINSVGPDTAGLLMRALRYAVNAGCFIPDVCR